MELGKTLTNILVAGSVLIGGGCSRENPEYPFKGEIDGEQIDFRERFSVDNVLGSVSFEQYREIAQRLEDSIRKVNPNVTSKLLLTTNGRDYHEYGSLTVVIPEVEEALSRREEHSLSDLNEDLWQRSFETELYIHDNTSGAQYMIALTVGKREPKSMKFYSQHLEEESRAVFNGFRKAGWFQRIGDGYSKPSPFAISHALK